MNVPPKAFKLKSQNAQPNAETPPAVSQPPAQPVPPPQNANGPLKLKSAFVPYKHIPPPSHPPSPPQMPPPAVQPAQQMQPQPQPAPQSATPQLGGVSQGRLLIHNRASIVPSVASDPPHAPVMTLRPESSPSGMPKNPASESFVNVKPALHKASTYDVPEKYQVPDMSEDLRKILENESENYKDQVQSFVDLCEILSKPGWNFADIADYIHMLVRSVNLDVLSIVLTDPSEKGKFCKVISRGYKSAPGPQVVAEWQTAVTSDATVNWNRLMDMAADKNTKTCAWICREGLHSVGYVPLHDSAKIYGFLFVGAYENKMPSALASSLLELCGDRIGIILESRRSVGTLPATATGVKIIKDELLLLSTYLEVLKFSAKLSPEEIVATSEKCLKTLAETKKLLDSFSGKQ